MLAGAGPAEAGWGGRSWEESVCDPTAALIAVAAQAPSITPAGVAPICSCSDLHLLCLFSSVPGHFRAQQTNPLRMVPRSRGSTARNRSEQNMQSYGVSVSTLRSNAFRAKQLHGAQAEARFFGTNL